MNTLQFDEAACIRRLVGVWVDEEETQTKQVYSEVLPSLRIKSSKTEVVNPKDPAARPRVFVSTGACTVERTSENLKKTAIFPQDCIAEYTDLRGEGKHGFRPSLSRGDELISGSKELVQKLVKENGLSLKSEQEFVEALIILTRALSDLLAKDGDWTEVRELVDGRNAFQHQVYINLRNSIRFRGINLPFIKYHYHS